MKKTEKHIPVRLTGLADGTHDVSLQVTPEEIGLPDGFGKPLDVSISVDKSHSQIALQVRVVSEASMPCDRCLQPVLIPIDAFFSLVYVHTEEDARAYDDEDVRVIEHSETVIDISDDVRDFALLCIPMRIACPENEYGEPTCDIDLPDDQFAGSGAEIDPRWEKLRDLGRENAPDRQENSVD